MDFENHNDGVDHNDPNSRPLSEQELIALIEKNASALQEQVETDTANNADTVTTETEEQHISGDASEAPVDTNVFSDLGRSQFEKHTLDEGEEPSSEEQPLKRQTLESDHLDEPAGHIEAQQLEEGFPDHNQNKIDKDIPSENNQNELNNGQIPQEDFSKLLEMNEADQLRFLTQHLQSVQEGVDSMEQTSSIGHLGRESATEGQKDDEAISTTVAATATEGTATELDTIAPSTGEKNIHTNNFPTISETIASTQTSAESTGADIISISTTQSVPETTTATETSADVPPESSSTTFNYASTHTRRTSEVPNETNDESDDLIITDTRPARKENEEAKILLRSGTLSIIDNLASQILEILIGKNLYQDTINIITQPESTRGIAYSTLLDIFQRTKLIFSDEQFLTSKIAGLDYNSRITKVILQRVNLVTFLAAVFGSIEVGFYHLNEYFLPTFVPDNGKLLKPLAGLYLDLKTQAYISALGQNEKSKSEVLDDLFPATLEQVLYSFRPDRSSLSPNEEEFITKCNRRRSRLEGEDSSEALAQTYQWLSFLKDLTEYVGKNHSQLIPPVSLLTNFAHTDIHNGGSLSSPIPISHNIGTVLPVTVASGLGESSITAHGDSSSKPNVQVWNSHDKQSFLNPQPKSDQSSNAIDPSLRPELYSSDTLTAYKAARRMMASNSINEKAEYTSSPAVVGKAGNLMYTRRPWTNEEEEALILGLDTVKGPYWSQILELYGPGGSISEVLKDRNQVQLKDKARNLKMFFLKCGLPVPRSFQDVTGDINSRKQSNKKTKERKKGNEANDQHTSLGQYTTGSNTTTTTGSSGTLTPNNAIHFVSQSQPTTISETSANAPNVSAAPLTDPNDINVDPMLFSTSHSDNQPTSPENIENKTDAQQTKYDTVPESQESANDSFHAGKNQTTVQNPDTNDLQGVSHLQNSGTADDNNNNQEADNDADNLEQLLQKVGEFINRSGVE